MRYNCIIPAYHVGRCESISHNSHFGRCESYSHTSFGMRVTRIWPVWEWPLWGFGIYGRYESWPVWGWPVWELKNLSFIIPASRYERGTTRQMRYSIFKYRKFLIRYEEILIAIKISKTIDRLSIEFSIRLFSIIFDIFIDRVSTIDKFR